jgi:glycyl-tRNA synthetase beta chain
MTTQASEFLFEIFSEEIPARFQAQAVKDLSEIARTFLYTHGVTFGELTSHVTPQRLVLMITNLSEQTSARTEERRGPRSDAPAAAIDGFLRSAGITLDECERRQTPKGEFLFAQITEAPRAVASVLGELVPHILQTLSWPKSMRWQPGSSFTWVRPIRRLLAIYNGHTLPVTLPFLNVVVGNTTQGHRFLAPELFTVTSLTQYLTELAQRYVIVDARERRQRILDLAETAAIKAQCRLHHDDILLDEITGLVEWPEALVGEIDTEFLTLPAPVLITSMRHHQKFFSLIDHHGNLSPKFLTIINTTPADGGALIIRGNERVLKARLSDAVFFDTQDRQRSLESYVTSLAKVTFHTKLGDMLSKTHRVQRLAAKVSEIFNITDPDQRQHIDRAATLLKADLVTSMVGEFPELQGVIGSIYAAHSGEAPEVCDAIRNQYAPAPQLRAVALIVALADRLDTLAGFFSIQEVPSGSKDPFALRRAALTIIRLLIDNQHSTDLEALCELALAGYAAPAPEILPQIMEFFRERLRVALRALNVRFDIVEAILKAHTRLDPWILQTRALALGEFLPTAMGQTMVHAWRRVENILSSASQEDIVHALDPDALTEPAEKNLWQCMRAIVWPETPLLTSEDYHNWLRTLVALHPAITEFFETVIVNSPDHALRLNRLALLKAARDLVRPVLNIKELEG